MATFITTLKFGQQGVTNTKETAGWGWYNTSVCKADGRYVMAIEADKPKELVGIPFTTFFAESKDLFNWKMLPTDCAYSKEKYTACPRG